MNSSAAQAALGFGFPMHPRAGRAFGFPIVSAGQRQSNSPQPPPATHQLQSSNINYNQPLPHQGVPYNPQAQPHPQQPMTYAQPQSHPQPGQAPHGQQQPHQQPQQENILLGFLTSISGNQTAVYGPPGSKFDMQGNVYFDLGNGRKEYIGVYRDNLGRIAKPRQPLIGSCWGPRWLEWCLDR